MCCFLEAQNGIRCSSLEFRDAFAVIGRNAPLRYRAHVVNNVLFNGFLGLGQNEKSEKNEGIAKRPCKDPRPYGPYYGPWRPCKDRMALAFALRGILKTLPALPPFLQTFHTCFEV